MNELKRCIRILSFALALFIGMQVAVFDNNATHAYASSDTYIKVNEKIHGNTDGYYWFVTNEPGVVSITFNHPYVNSLKNLWYLQLLKAEDIDWDENGFYHTEVKGIDPSILSYQMGLPAGAYYLRIDALEHESEKYTYDFMVNFTASTSWEEEDLSEDNDNYITLGEKVSGNLYYITDSLTGGDRDYYSFSLPKRKKIQILFEHEKLNHQKYPWRIRVTSTAANHYIEDYGFYSRGDKTKTYFDLGYLHAGDYYIEVYGDDEGTENYAYSDAVYTLTVNEDKRPDRIWSFASATVTKSSTTLQWDKSDDAAGYEIYRATSKNGKYKLVKTIKNRNTTKYKDKSLKKNKSYYYKICAYKTVNKIKYKSDFSSVKVVKTRR